MPGEPGELGLCLPDLYRVTLRQLKMIVVFALDKDKVIRGVWIWIYFRFIRSYHCFLLVLLFLLGCECSDGCYFYVLMY